MHILISCQSSFNHHWTYGTETYRIFSFYILECFIEFTKETDFKFDLIKFHLAADTLSMDANERAQFVKTSDNQLGESSGDE